MAEEERAAARTALQSARDALAKLPIAERVRAIGILLTEAASSLNVHEPPERESMTVDCPLALDLTERQALVLDWIERFMATNFMAPTLREISQGIGSVSTYAAHGHIDALVRKGYLEKVAGRSRALRIVKTARVA
jgi:hypothetical protein